MTALEIFGPLPADAAVGQLQTNCDPEEGYDLRKYTVGTRLRLVQHSDPCIPSAFLIGQILVVAPQNHCGMGIDAVDPETGRVDMVWPDEVEIID